MLEAALASMCSRLQSGERLCKRNYAEFRKIFEELVVAFGLERFRFRPYSIKRGAATAHFQHFGLLDLTTTRGRWKQARTARIYINQGLMDVVGASLHTVAKANLEAAARQVVLLFAPPPRANSRVQGVLLASRSMVLPIGHDANGHRAHALKLKTLTLDARRSRNDVAK